MMRWGTGEKVIKWESDQVGKCQGVKVIKWESGKVIKWESAKG